VRRLRLTLRVKSRLTDGNASASLDDSYAQETFGYSREEAVGSNVKILMKPGDAAMHDTYLHRYVQTRVKHVVGTARRVEAQTKKGGCISRPLDRVNSALRPHPSSWLRAFRGDPGCRPAH
jgi:hypothetical protein